MSPPAPQTDAIPPLYHCHWSELDCVCLNVTIGDPPKRQWTLAPALFCRHRATARHDKQYRKAGFELPLCQGLPCILLREVEPDGGLRR